ncbi:MAG: hypothetical protein HOP14_00465 [Acidobacteria bacterium]|nr:hypothetical protein [Acidobacteriota bacterium]
MSGWLLTSLREVRVRGLCLLVCLVLAGGGAVQAQRDAPLQALAPYTGQVLTLRTRAGHDVLIRLVRAEPDRLVVTVGGLERTFGVAEIAAVSAVGDSVRNGALIGAALGAVGLVFSRGEPPCPRGCPGRRAVGAGVAVGASAAIGAWVDARHRGRTVLYRSP